MPDAAPQTEPKPIAQYRAGDLVKCTWPPGDHLLGHNLLDREGVMVVAGVQKVGKSFLAIQAALSAMTNTSFLHLGTPQNDPNDKHPVSVLMLQGEVGERRMAERIEKTLKHPTFKGRGDDLSIAFPFHNIKVDQPGHIERIVNEFFEHAVPEGCGRAPDIVIFDPFAWFHAKEENSTPDMTIVCGQLDRLRREHGCAVIVVHHQSKSGLVQNTGHRMRGSSVLAGWYETLISMDWVDKRACKGPREITFELRNGEAPDMLTADFNPKYNVFDVLSDNLEPAQLENHVLRILYACPEGYKGSDLATQVYHASGRVYRAGASGLAETLERMKVSGVVTIDKESSGGAPRRRWVLTPEGRAYIDTNPAMLNPVAYSGGSEDDDA